MKKKLLFLAGAVLFLASCKKDYTCTCTQIYSQTLMGQTTTDTDSYVYKIKEVSKGTANSVCVSTKSSDSGEGWTSTREETCKLSK